MIRRLLLIMILVQLSACVQYSLVPSGQQSVGPLTFNLDRNWNKSPHSGFLHKDAQLWTVDGAMLNSIVFWPGLVDGDTLFHGTKSNPFPQYRADMLPTDVEAWVEGSLTKALGEGNAIVSSSGLRPVTSGSVTAFEFDIDYDTAGNVRYKGKVFVVPSGGGVSLIMYRAVAIHYYEALLPGYRAMVDSIRL